MFNFIENGLNVKDKRHFGEKKTKIISYKALKQDIRCTCTERDETKAFKSLQNVFVGAKFHISIIKAPLLAGGFAPAFRFANSFIHTFKQYIIVFINGKQIYTKRNFPFVLKMMLKTINQWTRVLWILLPTKTLTFFEFITHINHFLYKFKLSFNLHHLSFHTDNPSIVSSF